MRWSIDLRYALRALRRSPAFTSAVVLSLALGAALNIGLFGIIETVLLRPLPYASPDELYVIQDPRTVPLAHTHLLSPVEQRALEEGLRGFVSLGSYRMGIAGQHALRFESERIRAEGYAVSAAALEALGVRPVLGRSIMADDEVAGAEPVVLIGHALWQREFGGRPNVIGETLRVEGRERVVIGVMPRGFFFPIETAGFWIPLGAGLRADDHSLSLVGRVRPGSSVPAVEAEFRVLGARLDLPGERRWWRLVSFADVRRPSDAGFFFLLQVLALGILVVAALNVSNLLLLRGVVGRRDAAVRAALGASPFDLARPLVAELIILSLGAIAVGGVLVQAAASAVRHVVVSSALLALFDIRLDPRMLLFGAALAMIMVVVSVGPAIGTQVRVNPAAQLAGHGAAGTSTVGLRRLRSSLVVAQLAISLAFMANVMIVLRGVSRASAFDPGFRPAGLWLVPVRRADAPGAGPAAPLSFYMERLEAGPAVAGVAAATRLVPAGGRIAAGDRPAEADCLCQAVTVNYLELLGARLLAGEGLQGAAGTAVIDERLARRLWPGEPDVLGKTIRLGRVDTEAPLVAVAGVVRPIHFSSPALGDRDTEPPPALYVSARPDTLAAGALYVRVGPGAGAAALRDAMAAIDPAQPIHEIRPMESVLREEIVALRWFLALIAGFGALAVALAMVGLFGIVAFAAAQRRREIAVRLLLGATRRDVVQLVLRDARGLVVAGSAIGLGFSWLSGMLVRSVVFGTGTVDAAALAIGTAGLAVFAMAVCSVPAIRSSTMAPIEVLRST